MTRCQPCRGTGHKHGVVLMTCPPQYIPCPVCRWKCEECGAPNVITKASTEPRKRNVCERCIARYEAIQLPETD